MRKRLLSAAFAVSIAIQADLVENAGFEYGLENWTVYKRKSDTVDIVPRESGGKCLHIRKADSTKDYSGAHVSQTLQLQSNSQYEISLSFKTAFPSEPVKWAARVFIEGNQADKKNINRNLGQSSTWDTFSWTFNTDPYAKSVTISPRLTYSAGELWVDDIRVKQISGAIEVEAIADSTFQIVEASTLSGGKGIALSAGQTLTLPVASEAGARELRIFGCDAAGAEITLRAVTVTAGACRQLVDLHQFGTKLDGRDACIAFSENGPDQIRITPATDAHMPIIVDRISWGPIDAIGNLKTLCLETPLTESGKPVAVIVCSQRKSMYKLAGKLQKGISKASGGVELPIVTDTQWMQGDYRNRHALAIGNVLQNKLSERLYCLWYTREDALYPGKGGRVVRSVHDPWGAGKNVIVLAGSDTRGTSAAVKQFLRLLGNGPDLSVGRLLDIKISADLNDYFDTPDLAEVAEKLPKRSGRSLMSRTAYTGMRYLYTGNPDWLREYVMTLMEHKRRPEYGSATHMELWKSIRAWDCIEEAPELTDAERLECVNYLLTVLRSHEGAGNSHLRASLSEKSVRQNHEELAAMCAYDGGCYFKKYYQLAEAEQWLHMAEACFAGQEMSFKCKDESGDYEATAALWPLLHYAIANPEYRFLPSGTGKTFIDRCALTLDNRMALSGHGDCWNVDCFAPFTFALGAWYYHDPGYQFLLEKHYAMRPDRHFPLSTYPPFALHGVLDPICPTHFDGIQTAPLDPGHYRFYHGRQGLKWNLPWDRSFDKLSLRTRMDPEAQYMLLDGIACGSHGQLDANCIARFTDNDRVWLVDDSYVEGPTLADHNGVLVTRNGLADPLPACARLDAIADFAKTGISRTTLPDHTGVDWERNIFWIKETAFLFLDRMIAVKPGRFGFRVCWRTLGEAQLQGRSLMTRQRKTTPKRADQMVIVAGDDLATRLVPAPEVFNTKWKKYAYCDPIVNLLSQDLSRELEPGQAAVLPSLIYTSNRKKPHHFELRQLDPDTFVMTGDETFIAGFADGTAPYRLDSLELQAGAFLLSKNTLTAIQVEKIALAGKPIFSGWANAVMLDLKRRRLRVTTEKPTVVKIQGQENNLPSGGSTMTLKMLPRSFAPVFRSTLQSPANPVQTQPTLPEAPEVHCLARYDLDGPISALATVGSRVAAATGTGQAALLDSSGTVCWKTDYHSPVNALTTGDLDGDGTPEILLGANDARVIAVDQTGRTLWTFDCPPFPYRAYHGEVHGLLVSDLDGDGKGEVIVGARNARVHFLNGDGSERLTIKMKSETNVQDNFLALDLDGDGNKTVFSFPYFGCDGSVYELHMDGSEKRAGTDGWGVHIRDRTTADLNGDGHADIALVNSRGNIYYRLWKNKQLGMSQVFKLGAAATSMATLSRPGNLDQIVVGLEMGYVHAFDGKGTLLWSEPVSGSVTDMCALPLTTRPQVAVATTADTVEFFGYDGIREGRFSTNAPVLKLTATREFVAAGSAQGTVFLLAQSSPDEKLAP